MGKKVKIALPFILDDPIVGRTIFPFIGSFVNHIIIDGDKLTLNRKTYNLKTIDKLLLKKTEVTPYTSSHKLDPWGLIGTAIELYLVDNSGEKHILVPKFLINVNNWGQKKWDKFLDKLCKFSGLQIEEMNESAKSA